MNRAAAPGEQPISLTWEELPPFQPAACLLAERFGPAIDAAPGPVVVIPPALLAAVLRHAASTRDEVMGLLCGTALRDPSTGRLAAVVGAIRPMAATQASRTAVLADAESWRRTWTAAAPDAAGDQVVGWYHSHPGHGVFFSARDRQTHRECFTQPWQIGLVVDPSTGMFGAFGGCDGDAVRVLVHPVASQPAPDPASESGAAGPSPP